MYESFYNLKREPFRLSPDHNFCFRHRSYQKARDYLRYGYERAEGFVVVTGRPGTGKSTLIADLGAEISSSGADIAMLVCTQLEADDLLRMTADGFGINTSGEKKSAILQNFFKKLIKNFQKSRRSLLIIDEAQDLSLKALEELRLLTNLNAKNRPILQIFLLGQPELNEILQDPEMEQVHQRMVAASKLEPLDEIETRAYIIHRLRKVGWVDDPQISEAVFPIIHGLSTGIPRRINLICSRLLLHASVEELHRVGIDDIRKVAEELVDEQLVAADLVTDISFEGDDSFARDHGVRDKVTVENFTISAANEVPGREVDSASAGKTRFEGSDPSYRGPERRRQSRRQQSDRRHDIRFESGNDQRKNPGRRKGDVAGSIWKTTTI